MEALGQTGGHNIVELTSPDLAMVNMSTSTVYCPSQWQYIFSKILLRQEAGLLACVMMGQQQQYSDSDMAQKDLRKDVPFLLKTTMRIWEASISAMLLEHHIPCT
eukprot:15364590-Ditylum_brightwellii.AAC.2